MDVRGGRDRSISAGYRLTLRQRVSDRRLRKGSPHRNVVVFVVGASGFNTFPTVSRSLWHLLETEVFENRQILQYDQANRLSSVTGTKAGTPTPYASSMSYADHGALASAQLGNGLWEHANFNTRLQPLSIGLGTTATDSSVLGLQYAYVSPNNGNVQSQTITFSGFSATQNYGYDPMNRLKTAVEADRDQNNKGWSQTYVFDSAGNRALMSGTEIGRASCRERV